MSGERISSVTSLNRGSTVEIYGVFQERVGYKGSTRFLLVQAPFLYLLATFIAFMYAIVDIETTGGHAAGNDITEIAIVVHDGEKDRATFLKVW